MKDNEIKGSACRRGKWGVDRSGSTMKTKPKTLFRHTSFKFVMCIAVGLYIHILLTVAFDSLIYGLGYRPGSGHTLLSEHAQTLEKLFASLYLHTIVKYWGRLPAQGNGFLISKLKMLWT